MKTRPLYTRQSRNLKRMLGFMVLTLVLVAGLFFASVFMPPLAAPVHALIAPPVASPQEVTSGGVNGTLASFTALIPELVTNSLPLVSR